MNYQMFLSYIYLHFFGRFSFFIWALPMLRQGIVANISSQRHVVDTFHRASKLKWSFLVLVVRLDHLVHEGGAVGGELLTRGGAVEGGQVEERVHLIGSR